MESLWPRAAGVAGVRSLSLLLAILAAWPACALAQEVRRAGTPPDLTGVYQSVSNGTILPGGLKNSGSPGEIALLPAAAEEMKNANPKDDPWRMCQPIGEFRMMAREHTKIQLAPVNGMIVMLFEDIAHGLIRTIYMKRGHSERPTTGSDPNLPFSMSTWLGDSVGHWEGDTLVVDTIGFNTRTWLNDAGAPHSEALHLVERIRPIRGGQVLEYKMIAEDPMALAKPYTYTRYYEKLNTEIADDICRDEE
jgi:hypothetical protein